MSGTTRAAHGAQDRILRLLGRVRRQAVSKVFHYIDPPPAAKHTKARHVVVGIEQVLAVRRREHQVLMRPISRDVQRHILTSMIQVQHARRRQTVWKGGLAVQLMRKLLLMRHRRCMRACRLDQSFIEFKGRGAGFGAGLVRHIQ